MLIVPVVDREDDTDAEGARRGLEKHRVVVVVPPDDAPWTTGTEEAQEGRAALLWLIQ
jgi:hypothetical protein